MPRKGELGTNLAAGLRIFLDSDSDPLPDPSHPRSSQLVC